MTWFYKEGIPLSLREQERLSENIITQLNEKIGIHFLKKVLLLPPDITRYGSGAGFITHALYASLRKRQVTVKVMPTLGQHRPHTVLENQKMFLGIPEEDMLRHDWLKDNKYIGTIPKEDVLHATKNEATWSIPLEVNRTVLEGGWDVLINIGRVVPHEIFGMANYNKNLFIGLGGKRTLAATQLAAACYGAERLLGDVMPPLRRCFHHADDHFLKKALGKTLNVYVLLVKTPLNEGTHEALTGWYVGTDESTYLQAAAYAKKHLIYTLNRKFSRLICLVEDEVTSTWVANKAIYRTRSLLKRGGELIIIAPHVKQFGENALIDRFIRQYGYTGKHRLMKAIQQDSLLKTYSNAASHLIHGSPEGMFQVRYASQLSRDSLREVGYEQIAMHDALDLYHKPQQEDYCITHPSRALWKAFP